MLTKVEGFYNIRHIKKKYLPTPKSDLFLFNFSNVKFFFSLKNEHKKIIFHNTFELKFKIKVKIILDYKAYVLYCD